MFWVFILSFVVDILAFFGLKTVWAIFEKLGNFFFKSSGHPGPEPSKATMSVSCVFTLNFADVNAPLLENVRLESKVCHERTSLLQQISPLRTTYEQTVAIKG